MHPNIAINRNTNMSDGRWSWFGSSDSGIENHGDYPLAGLFIIVFCIAILIALISVPCIAFDKATKMNKHIQKTELLKETDMYVKTLIERNKFEVSINDLTHFKTICNTQNSIQHM